MPIAAVGIMAATGLAGGIMQSRAAGKAAGAQADAALQAAQLDKQAKDEALAFQKEVWNTQQAQQQPWLNAGTSAINTLSSLTSPGGQLATVPQFQAPTGVTEQNDPGYQFRLAEGQKALERSSAAKGSLFSGGTQKALARYGQDYASNEYNNVYNRALTEYNSKVSGQNTLFNRYAALSGVGQTAANTLGQQGSQAAGNTGNILMNYAANAGQQMNNAGAARASGYVGGANAWANTIGNLGQLPFLYYQMQNGSSSPSYGSGTFAG